MPATKSRKKTVEVPPTIDDVPELCGKAAFGDTKALRRIEEVLRTEMPQATWSFPRPDATLAFAVFYYALKPEERKQDPSLLFKLWTHEEWITRHASR